MWIALAITIVFCFLFGLVIHLAQKEAKKDAQLRALKKEIENRAKEQKHAQEMLDNVRNFDEHTVRQRLHEIANNQR